MANVVEALIDDESNFQIDFASGFLAAFQVPIAVRREKPRPVLAGQKQPAEPAHAELLDHPRSNVVGLLQVAGCPGGDLAQSKFLSDRTAETDLDARLQLRARQQQPVGFGALQNIAASQPARDDRDFVNGVAPRNGTGYQRMPRLMDGDAPLLLRAHDAALALQPNGAAFDCLVEILHRDSVASAPGGQERGLVDKVREIRTDRAGSQ